MEDCARCAGEAKWQAWCGAIEHPQLVMGLQFRTAADRKAHEDALDPLFTAWTNGLVPPPIHQEDDPDCVDESYLGFVMYTPRGRHQEDGGSWWQVLAEEIAYYQHVQLEEADTNASDDEGNCRKIRHGVGGLEAGASWLVRNRLCRRRER